MKKGYQPIERPITPPPCVEPTYKPKQKEDEVVRLLEEILDELRTIKREIRS